MKEILGRLRDLTTEVEATVIGIVAAIIPWLAPLIPASIAYHNMREVLLFSPRLSAIGALVVEFLGLSAVDTAVKFWNYNQTKRKTDEAAPFYVAAGVGAFYLVIVLAVNVILDQTSIEQLVAKALLSLVSVPAGITMAIRAQHSRQLLELRAEKQERRELRRVVAPTVAPATTTATRTRPVAETTATQLMATTWKSGMRAAELARLTGVNKGTCHRWIQKRQMVASNGHHIEEV